MKDNKMHEIDKSQLDQVTGGSDRLSMSISPMGRRIPQRSALELEYELVEPRRERREFEAEFIKLLEETDPSQYMIIPVSEAQQ